MVKSFAQMMKILKEQPSNIIAVAAAQDEDVLLSVSKAKELGFADAILVGDSHEISDLCSRLAIDHKQFEIIHVPDRVKAAQLAVELVNKGKADLVMKGLLGTADILKAVLNKDFGLRKEDILSHVTVIEAHDYGRLMLMTDAAMNIAPDIAQKVGLLQNASEVARALGIQKPKAAVIAAVELVNEDMPATVDAAILTQMSRRGQIKGVDVDGPLALDNAVSIASAKHKGILGTVAGQADILLMPDIEAANVMYKALAHFSTAKLAGVIMGARVPVILTSRADTPETKLHSIALACYLGRGF